jgi:alkylation response protein AidB-like acyl-CoA dehydrogenase
MTIESDYRPAQLVGARSTELTPDILRKVTQGASALDGGEQSTRGNIQLLSRAGLLGLGAPGNSDGKLPAMASVIQTLAAECMSTAFSVWAHRMTIEYLEVAATPWSLSAAGAMLAGDVLGVTGMASAFKDAAGCGSLDLSAVPADNGYSISGTLRWASNLYSDSIMVTAARVDSGEKLIIALPLSSPGVTMGEHFDLLALGSTASSYLTLNDVQVGTDQVLSRGLEAFLGRVRPTFLLLQSAMCLGLARRCLHEARTHLASVNSVFTAETNVLGDQLGQAESALASYAQTTGGPATPGVRELLTLRLAAAEVVNSAAALEIRTAGGKGYARGTDASRRFREAAFIPVQSPSEAQLRWELGNFTGGGIRQ